MRQRSIAGVLLGLILAVGTSCGSSSNDSADSGSGTATATSTQGSTQTSTAATAGNVHTSSSSGTDSTAAGGSGGSSSSSSTTATSTTGNGSGGSAGDASVSSNTTSTGAGGSGGAPGACPSEPPVDDTPCAWPGPNCAYEDCAAAGRTIATCNQGTWLVETSACSEMVYCSGGSEICAAGEICLIMAGGAFLQECVPNTCEGQAVECDCTEGCSGDCTTFASAETGITITCDTCPNDLCP